MTLPTFLGIGVPRAGTTWLHTLLTGHPEVYLPEKRKEVRFFDRHFDRGLGWYEGFFCPDGEAHRYRAIGEISPQYFYCDECPSRISQTLPNIMLLLMLRHPVDRAYSNYGFAVQRRNYRGSFREFVDSRPQALEKGLYSSYLRRYLRVFDRSRVLALLFEEAVGDGDVARGAVARFLDVPAEGFPASVGKVNASSVPRHGSLSNLAVKTGRTLRRNHLEPLVDLGARLGIRRLITKGDPLPKLDPELKRELSRGYEAEFDDVEALIDIDLSAWRLEKDSA